METDAQARQEVLAVEAARATAMVQADVITIAALTADDYVHVESTGRRRTKSEFLSGLGSEYVFETFVIDCNEVRVYGNTAVVTGNYHNDIRTPDGLRPTKYARHVRVYVKVNGAWLNVVHQATEMQEMQKT